MNDLTFFPPFLLKNGRHGVWAINIITSHSMKQKSIKEDRAEENFISHQLHFRTTKYQRETMLTGAFFFLALLLLKGTEKNAY